MGCTFTDKYSQVSSTALIGSSIWLPHKDLLYLFTIVCRSDMSAAIIGEKLYVMGGYDGVYDALNSKS